MRSFVGTIVCDNDISKVTNHRTNSRFNCASTSNKPSRGRDWLQRCKEHASSRAEDVSSHPAPSRLQLQRELRN